MWSPMGPHFLGCIREETVLLRAKCMWMHVHFRTLSGDHPRELAVHTGPTVLYR